MPDELTSDDVVHDLQHLLAYGWGRLEIVVQRHAIEAIQLSPVKKRRSDTARLEKILLTALKDAP